MPRQLFLSVALHVSVIGLLLQPKTIEKRLTGIEVVHAAAIEPLWDTTLTVPPPPSAATHPSETTGPANNPPSSVIDERSAVQEIAAVSNEIRGVLEERIPSEVSQQLSQSRFAGMPHLDANAEDLSLAPPPESPPKSEDALPKKTVPTPPQVEQARLLKQLIPVYPQMARTARVEGVVIVDATITETGLLEDLNVVDGHPMLIASALNALSKWRYAPARLNGNPTRSSVRITVRFRLEYQ